MKIYSPSQTTTWMDCPLKRQYDQLGYQRRGYSLSDVKKEIGTVLHTALNVFCTTGSATQADLALTTTLEATPIGPVFSWLDYELPMRKVLEKVVKEQPWQQYGWKTAGGALRLEKYGNCEFDHLLSSDAGTTFNDFKTSWEKDARYRPRWWQEQSHSWQFLHYVWAFEEHFKTTIDRFGVTLLICTPRPYVEFQEIRVHREKLEMFKKSAPYWWESMQEEEFLYLHDSNYRAPFKPHCINQYGMCTYYDACHVYHGNYQLMEVGYEKEERKVQDAGQK